MNIFHGISGAGSIRQAYKISDDEIMVSVDVLSCGPLKEFTNIEEWVQGRESYWGAIFKDNSVDPIPFNESPREFYQCLGELEGCDPIILWIGSSLNDQLFLAFVVFLLDRLNVSVKKLSVIQFEKLNDRNHVVRGLGELSPEQIKQHPKAFQLSDKQVAFCLNVWQAVTHKNPEKLLEILQIETPGLPILHRAIQVLLFRYPDHSTGLSHWDEALLKATQAHGPKAARVIGHTMGEGMFDHEQDVDDAGDLYLFSRLKNLARQSQENPLIHFNGMDLPMRETEVEISDTGCKILEGRQSRAGVGRIDDWVGGVHLDSSTGSMWFRKDQELLFKSIGE